MLVICLPLQKRAGEQLAARIDEFEAKKFKPPQTPLQCEAQAQEVVKCYRCVRLHTTSAGVSILMAWLWVAGRRMTCCSAAV
jgi:hypothetical protein